MFRKRSKPPVVTLEPVAIEELLRSFEDEHFALTGERITSAEFYDRYKGGEIDTPDAIRWASYYELLRAQGQEALADPERRRSRRSVVAA